MCILSPRKFFNYIRFLPVFAVTLIIGLWVAGFFAANTIRFYVEKTFTVQEAEELVGKKVTIRLPKREPRDGTVTGFTTYGSIVLLKICCNTIERMENAENQFSKDVFDGYGQLQMNNP
ncbi:MAG: hypothetical protein WKF92_12190 [Pyrinomonadaceae bacterium]